MIVIACSLMHVLSIGLQRAFGVFFVELRQVFNASASSTSWIVAIAGGTSNQWREGGGVRGVS